MDVEVFERVKIRSSVLKCLEKEAKSRDLELTEFLGWIIERYYFNLPPEVKVVPEPEPDEKTLPSTDGDG